MKTKPTKKARLKSLKEMKEYFEEMKKTCEQMLIHINKQIRVLER